jgi:MFS family permease
LLVLCRLVQGFSTGGEWGGAAAFLVEYAPPGKRGFIGSMQQFSVGLALIAATLSAAVVHLLVCAGAGRAVLAHSGFGDTGVRSNSVGAFG